MHRVFLLAISIVAIGCAAPVSPDEKGYVTSTCKHCVTTINGDTVAKLRVSYSTGTTVTITVSDSSLVQVFSRNTPRVFDTTTTGPAIIHYTFKQP